jgi:hypothetical protein
MYKMRDERQREKQKERIDQIEEIKIEIQSSQLQTIIIFDRKLQLRDATRPRKAYDEIYKVNTIPIFRSQKNIILTLKNAFEVFSSVFFCFFLEIV